MWPETEKTQEILRRAGAGEKRAVDDLFERHRAAVRRLIDLRLDPRVKARVDASDIVQEVLIEAHRRLAEYLAKPVVPFHIWLRQLARDHIIDAYRRHRGAARRSVDREERGRTTGPDGSSIELFARLSAGGLTPAAAAMRKEMEERFHAALEELDEIDREIIVMRHVEQLSNQESAQALGLSEPAAGMRYLRALRRLRGVLGVEEEASS